ncbi:hypothetical protein Tco_0915881 [Tanacetum coccineum]
MLNTLSLPKTTFLPSNSNLRSYRFTIPASLGINDPGKLYTTSRQSLPRSPSDEIAKARTGVVLEYGSWFRIIQLGVFCYTDVGYLTDAGDLKSQTGYVFILNRGVVDWKSIKQSIFATSSTDDRYIAAFDALKEVVWIRKFIFGLGVVLTIEEPINMYCDNTGAIAIVKDHGVTKEAPSETIMEHKGARHFLAQSKVRYLEKTLEKSCRRTHCKHTAEDDLEVFSTDDLGLDWISAHNFLTRLQKLSSYASGHLEVSELVAFLEKASFSNTSDHDEVF